MPIKADSIRGFRALVISIVMNLLDELGLITPSEKAQPKPPPDPLEKNGSSKAEKVASILLVFCISSLIICSGVEAKIRPRSIDTSSDLPAWNFGTAVIISGTITASDGVIAPVTGALDGVLGGNTPAAASVTTLGASSTVTATGGFVDGSTAGADKNVAITGGTLIFSGGLFVNHTTPTPSPAPTATPSPSPSPSPA